MKGRCLPDDHNLLHYILESVEGPKKCRLGCVAVAPHVVVVCSTVVVVCRPATPGRLKWLGGGFPLTPAKVPHHKHDYLRGRCNASSTPNKGHQIGKHNGHSTFPFPLFHHFLPKHDQFVESLDLHGNSLLMIDFEDPSFSTHLIKIIL